MFETREQVLEKVLSQKKPLCPNCNVEMSIWEVPPMNFSDGLGWGVPYLFLCFNDDCPLYKNGWDEMKENYAHVASYRCMNYPGTDQYELMPVFSPMGAQGQIIDDQAVAAEEALKESMKKGFSILADCYVAKDGPTVMRMVLDPTEPMRVRVKAAEMIGDIGETDETQNERRVHGWDAHINGIGNEMDEDQVEARREEYPDKPYQPELAHLRSLLQC